jgi:hypothetical protein
LIKFFWKTKCFFSNNSFGGLSTFYHKIPLEDQAFFLTKFLRRSKRFLSQNFFGDQAFLLMKFLWSPLIFFPQKSFGGPNAFSYKIPLVPFCVFYLSFFALNLILTSVFRVEGNEQNTVSYCIIYLIFIHTSVAGAQRKKDLR